MSPLIREYAALVPFDPVQYVWIDFASAPMLSQAQSDVITERLRAFPYNFDTPNSEWPLPFEDMCLLLPFTYSPTLRKRDGVLVTTLQRKGEQLIFSMWSNADVHGHPSISIRSNKSLETDCRMTVTSTYAKAVGQTEEECQNEGIRYFKLTYRRVMAMVLLGLTEGIATARPTAPKSFINAKRIKKGKRPFFEWTTVVVEPRAVVPDPEPKGGTHASPKPHMRRGHVRRYKSGKVVTIKSMIVNKHKMPEEGFLFHDYRVENPVVH